MNRPIEISLAKFPITEIFQRKNYQHFEFHISKNARDKYHFDQSLFTLSGNVIFPNFHAVRIFAHKMNEKKDLRKFPDRVIKPGELNAMGLIDEIFHYVLRLYEETTNPGVFNRAIFTLINVQGEQSTQKILEEFTIQFPPLEIYQKKKSINDYFTNFIGNKSTKEIALEEIILLYFANINPAFNKFKELFDDEQLKLQTDYDKAINELKKFFETQARFGPDNQAIFDLLMAPIIASPNSLQGQLEFIKKHWGMLLSQKFFNRMLSADDLIKEDFRLIIPDSEVPTVVPTYDVLDYRKLTSVDVENFTQDIDWMPKVVMLAKNLYVWLDQLSRKYKRPITRLDQIPDEELDRIAQWNFTALWLIGIWERSPASSKIKRIMGNPEAVSSAYSLYDYVIASNLGGEDAYRNLQTRAWQRGIRLAGDMVPNHMGIYSKWIIEHPEYFIQTSYSPFPNYQFTGENLSEHPDIQIKIEDGYWTHRDAAVVFQWVNNKTGQVRYIYHGNDGTHMPWNDTAQLDYLKAEVREAVIQTIFHVARKFPIIRFDAAMTLTKQHFQRLWYPQPGTGGDIPSRADWAISKSEFDRLFPTEFWREVVDRINQEMPDTLLLAEAFWLLEGYFVRSLGMHRVYNSAFMNMLMREENSKYRELIKNTLEFNPEILKRYVNFMSNPDEQTAVVQFGKGDKYFGVALMMVTLPGLPMFAHGQIEGLTEKYGMEYQRAYYDEQPDEDLIKRHEREIFPLLKKRYLFSQVENFELFDFVDARGFINENVFAYSNRKDIERAIVCFHNKFEECSGWIKTSVNKASLSPAGTEKRIERKNLTDALQLKIDDKIFYTFREYFSGLEFIQSSKILSEHGLFLEMKAYQYKLFFDFQEVWDETGEYARATEHLKGQGVRNLKEFIEDLRLYSVHQSLRQLLHQQTFDLIQQFWTQPDNQLSSNILNDITEKYIQFISSIKKAKNFQGDEESLISEFKSSLKILLEWKKQINLISKYAQEKNLTWWSRFSEQINIETEQQFKHGVFLIFLWICFYNLGKLLNRLLTSENSIQILNDLRVHKITEHEKSFLLTKIFIRYPDLLLEKNMDKFKSTLIACLNNTDVQQFLMTNYYNGIWYYNKEQFDTMLQGFAYIALFKILQMKESIESAVKELEIVHHHFSLISNTSESVGYNLQQLKERI